MRGSEQDGPERTGTELTRYVHSARSYLPLTREEEHQIAVRARRGDAAASHRLIRHNLALVASIARRQVRGAVQLDDLIQEGNLGLLRAVELFDPQAGTRFSTYAVWWIRAFMGRYLRQARSAVRPRSGMLAACDVSLDAVVGRGDLTRLELLEDEGPTAESRYLAEEGASQLRGALGRVRARIGEVGWSIVHERLQQDEPRSLTDLGHRWGLSRERVRQVELRTRRFLRSHLERVAREADAPSPRVVPRVALRAR